MIIPNIIVLVLSNSSSEITLTFDLLRDIWETVVNNAFIKAERDVLYRWLKESTESKTTFPMSIEDLVRFFKEKMTDESECKYLTSEGFKCFKNLFLLINEKLNKIVKAGGGSNSGMVSYGSAYSHVNGTSYSSYSYNHEEKNSQVKFFAHIYF